MKWVGWGVILLLIVVVASARNNAGSNGPDMSRIFVPPGLYEVAPDGTYVPVQRDQAPGGAR